MVGSEEMIVLTIAEIRKADQQNSVFRVGQRQAQLRVTVFPEVALIVPIRRWAKG